MNFLNGTDYLLYVDLLTPLTSSRGTLANYRPIACGTSNGFNMDSEAISLRNKCDNGFDNSRPGYISWGMDIDGFAVGLRNSEKILKANFSELADIMKSKKIFWLKWEDINTSVTREGKAWISSFRETAGHETPYSFTANFVGVGEPFLSENIIKTVLATVPSGNTLLQTGNNKLIQTQ